jgi:hypothetical protein
MSNKMTFKEAIEDMKKRREKTIEECCLMVEADAKLLSPVKTGTLRRSITHIVKSDDEKTEGDIGSSVEYAWFAEQKVPYLEPAVDQNLESIKRKIAEVLNT